MRQKCCWIEMFHIIWVTYVIHIHLQIWTEKHMHRLDSWLIARWLIRYHWNELEVLPESVSLYILFLSYFVAFSLCFSCSLVVNRCGDSCLQHIIIATANNWRDTIRRLQYKCNRDEPKWHQTTKRIRKCEYFWAIAITGCTNAYTNGCNGFHEN